MPEGEISAQAAAAAEPRERWDSRLAFLMAVMGSAVGLGNVWRFPAVAYANGGGAFFIPYFVALLTAGIPLLILEFAVGQMMQGSAPKALSRLHRNFEWVGWFALLVATVISIYYAVIMAYACDYLWLSFSKTMPWSAAGGPAPEKEFFFREFLQLSTEPSRMWGVRWPVVAGLALTWVAVFLIIHKGVHRVGKVVLVTVPLPWILLLVLVIRGLTLDGASSGVEYYLRPDFEALKRPETWLAAYGQVFFSLSIGFGIMIAYASYRPRRSDIVNNAFIVSFADSLTSFLAGFAVFSVLGFLAYKTGLPVPGVVSGGPGLAFVTYPAAITRMGDLGWIWSPLVGVLFFLMLLSLGIDSLFSLVEAATAGIQDRFPRLNRNAVAAALCAFGFLAGLLFCTRAGLAWIDLFDHWASDYGLVLVGLLECVLIGYFYKPRRLRGFADKVSEVRLGGWWELCILAITPAVLVYVLATSLIGEFTKPYGSSDWPAWMLWVARAVFLALLVAALGITRKWHFLAIAGFAVVAGLVTYAIVAPPALRPEAESAAATGGDPATVSFRSNLRDPADAVAFWDFGDGAVSTELDPTHVYARPDTYTARLVCRSRGGRGPASSARVEVHARPLGFEETSLERRRTVEGRTNPLAWRFKARAAWGHKPYRYRWDFGDGTVSSEPEGEHDYPAPGRYTARVVVEDSSPQPQRAEETLQIEVLPRTLVLRADPLGGEAPVKVRFAAEVYDERARPVPLDGLSFRWDFGDGSGSDERGPVEHRYDLAPQDSGRIQAGGWLTRTATLAVGCPDGSALEEKVEIRLRPPEERSPARAALLAGFGAALLVGGLALSLLIARERASGTAESKLADGTPPGRDGPDRPA